MFHVYLLEVMTFQLRFVFMVRRHSKWPPEQQLEREAD